MDTIIVPGDQVPSTFNAAIVAASYFVSLCGSSLTIELLHRRGTALHSWRSWYESLACALAMGLVGIWCMHFIGNRAIILDRNQPEIQLVYHSGFTVLSAVLPVIGLTIAFSVAELTTTTRWLRWTALACTGVFAGLSVVGMHYVANFGVSNYTLTYKPRFLAASIAIAIGDCVAVLFLFYNLREMWISSWWKRVLCAMLLAGGVSAMHFTASTSCTYRLRHFNSPKDITSRNKQVVIAGTICGTAAFVAFGFLLYTHWRNRRLKSRSQHITLACVMFDSCGRLLVTTEGLLPSRRITRKYNHGTSDDDFDDAHPVFQWLFRVTYNWQSIGDLIPNMKSHLRAQTSNSPGATDSRPSSSQSSAVYDDETYSDYAILFKERFCTAAASMAASMNWPIENLGVLYDKIIETGTMARLDEHVSKIGTLTTHRYLSSTATEKGIFTSYQFGKGQVLTITREVDHLEAHSLLNAGFRFADVQHVGRNISQAMQITLPTFEAHISGLKSYVENLQLTHQKQGTYLAYFALIPKLHQKGFDVAVKKDKRNELPDVKLLDGRPESWQMAILNKLDGQSVSSIMVTLQDRAGSMHVRTNDDQERRFAATLRTAISTLIQPFPQVWTKGARLWSKPLLARYSFGDPNPTTLFAFTVIGDMHASIDKSDVLVRTPKAFFEARHRCYAGSPDHTALARDVHQTFAPLYASRRFKKKTSRLGKLSINLTGSPLTEEKHPSTAVSDDLSGEGDESGDHSTSVHEPFDKWRYASMSSSDSEGLETSTKWGGILVNSEITTQSDIRSGFSHGGIARNMPMGANVAVSTAEQEVIFANELFNITKERFMPASGPRG